MDKNMKNIIIFVIAIIVIFALTFVVRFFDDSDEVVSIEGLHFKNLQGKESEINYMHEGYSFVFFDNLWYTQVKRGNDILDIPLHFGAKDLENVSIKGEINWELEKPEVYITFNPEGDDFKFLTLSVAELSLNLARGMEIVPIAACIKNVTSACEDRPIVTCDDEDKSVIYLSEGELDDDVEPEVILDGNCVTIIGKDWDLVRATDRFLLQWYTVMKS